MSNDERWIEWLPELDAANQTWTISDVPEDQYHYRPIDKTSSHIRLLRLDPIPSGAEVRGQLRVHSLTAAPAYTALSYTWGRPTSDCHILLDGKRHGIRKNLLRFLTEVARQPAWASRWYWIDAICIDQTDHAERTHQVSNMAEIYRSASSVLAWLGPSYEQSDLAFRTMKRKRPMKFPALTEEPAWKAIEGLCRRPYWTRLWVVQELTLAISVDFMCGVHIVPWKTLTRVEHEATAYSRFCSEFLNSKAVSMLRNVRQSQSYEVRYNEKLRRSRGHNLLYNQIFAFQGLECSDPRDRIYAVLGISEEGRDEITPDYQKPLRKVLHDVLRKYHQRQPPGTLEMVIEQCKSLSKVVGLDSNALMDFSDCRRSSGVPPTDDLQSLLLQKYGAVVFLEGHILMYWWAVAHDHPPVQDLCNRLLGYRCYNPGVTLLWRHAIEGDIDRLRDVLDDVQENGQRHPCPYACCAASSDPLEKPDHFVDDLGYRLAAALFATKCGHVDAVVLLARRGSISMGAFERCVYGLSYGENRRLSFHTHARVGAKHDYKFSRSVSQFLYQADRIEMPDQSQCMREQTCDCGEYSGLRRVVQELRVECIGDLLLLPNCDADVQAYKWQDYHQRFQRSWRSSYERDHLRMFAVAIVLTLQPRDSSTYQPQKEWREPTAALVAEAMRKSPWDRYISDRRLCGVLNEEVWVISSPAGARHGTDRTLLVWPRDIVDSLSVCRAQSWRQERRRAWAENAH